MSTTRYEVVRVHAETDEVTSFQFRALDGSVPDWSAGAHLRVALPDGGDRAYSLMRLPKLAEDLIALGVRREPESTGGSEFMHRLAVGDQLQISAPANHFELGEHPHTILIAGGIGITPILSHCAELVATGRSYQVHYAGRTEGALGFVTEMLSICESRLALHYDDQPGAIKLQTILEAAATHTHVYCCGPAGMIDAVIAIATELQWQPERIHYERFSTGLDNSENTAFDVQIHDTGQVVHVPADKSIIEALEQAGVDPLYDCQRGDCGICQCDVIEGIPDHRDVILTDEEKASNSVMQICVSRAKTPTLVIDL